MLGYYSERCYLYAMRSKILQKKCCNEDFLSIYFWMTDAIYAIAAGISSREHIAYLAKYHCNELARQGYSKAIKFLAIVQKQPWGEHIR